MLNPILVFIVLLSNLLLAESVMQFTVEEDYINRRAKIYASGDIERGTALKFVNFIKQNNIGRAIVYFNSYGGSLQEGIVLGQIIREMGYDTSIGTTNNRMSGTCASACAYAFSGGVARYIYYDKQRLGLHQFYSSDGLANGNIASTQKTTGDIVKYLSAMGIDEQAFVVASSTNKNTMTWLTKAEAISLNFANNGKDNTTAEIKITPTSGTEQKPYLKIEQIRAEGIGKILMYCKDNSLHLLAGIMTTHDVSTQKRENAVRNYLELSDGEFLLHKGKFGTSVKGKTLWIKRQLYEENIHRFLNSQILNIWTEDGGVMRWGLEMDLYPVKEKIRTFVKGCNYNEREDILSLF